MTTDPNVADHLRQQALADEFADAISPMLDRLDAAQAVEADPGPDHTNDAQALMDAIREDTRP